MRNRNIITEALSLPVEKRALLADSLLKSLNPSQTSAEKKWLAVAKKRLSEIRKDKGILLSGDDVFRKIFKRFS